MEEIIPRRKPDYRLEQVENELLLYHPGQTTIIYCNPSASLVWQLCDGRRSVGEMVALLRAAYPEAGESLTADVTAILAEFRQHGAIEYVERAAGA